MLNKKGDGLSDSYNHLISILLAVIGIALILFVGYKLFDLQTTQEQESAKATLNSLTGKIDALEPGQNNTFLIQGFPNAIEWSLYGWGINDEARLSRPEKCFFQSCICVCESAQTCQESGICQALDVDSVSVISHSVSGGGYKGEGGNLYLQTIGSINLQNGLMEVEVLKNEDNFTVSHYSVAGGGTFDDALAELPSLGKYFNVVIDERANTETVERFYP